jgi:hypothetical protein
MAPWQCRTCPSDVGGGGVTLFRMTRATDVFESAASDSCLFRKVQRIMQSSSYPVKSASGDLMGWMHTG